jgi:hypothetical protein
LLLAYDLYVQAVLYKLYRLCLDCGVAQGLWPRIDRCLVDGSSIFAGVCLVLAVLSLKYDDLGRLQRYVLGIMIGLNSDYGFYPLYGLDLVSEPHMYKQFHWQRYRFFNIL